MGNKNVEVTADTEICEQFNIHLQRLKCTCIQDKKGVVFCSNSPFNNGTTRKPSSLKIEILRSLTEYRNLRNIG